MAKNAALLWGRSVPLHKVDRSGLTLTESRAQVEHAAKVAFSKVGSTTASFIRPELASTQTAPKGSSPACAGRNSATITTSPAPT